MKVQILLSTMKKNNDDINKLIKDMNIRNDCLVINQCNKEERFESVINNNKITVINSSGIGLSKSRNLAIKSSTSDICIIADDDLKYVNDLKDIVIREFNKNNGYDILVFKVYGRNKEFKTYINKEKKINYLSSMKISSVQIALKKKEIIDKNIYFNELLGAGAKYSMGEENEFLFKCLREGIKIKYIPIKIADLYIGESSWFNGYDRKYFIDRGASFAAMSKIFSDILIIQFALRKRNIYKDKFSILEAIRIMFLGKKRYLYDCKNYEEIKLEKKML